MASTFKKITEQSSLYDSLESMDTLTLVQSMNAEDHKVAVAVERCLQQIVKVIDAAYEKLRNGGRMFYIGAGTSGRLGILDASECPPTFGVAPTLVNGIIAGGDKAIRHAVENAEDDPEQAFKDLTAQQISGKDIVIGLAASGTTPYVLGGIHISKEHKILTSAITCNPGSPLACAAELPIVPVVGPEFITGSSRMKAGTAQKMVLNMISTGVMVKLGRVKGNRMIDMQLSNAKLVDRGTRMIMEQTGLNYDSARDLLKSEGDVRSALNKNDIC